jgi:hypothetical protein
MSSHLQTGSYDLEMTAAGGIDLRASFADIDVEKTALEIKGQGACQMPWPNEISFLLSMYFACGSKGIREGSPLFRASIFRSTTP